MINLVWLYRDTKDLGNKLDLIYDVSFFDSHNLAVVHHIH